MIPLRGSTTSGRWPLATLGLIVLNFAVFLYTQHLGSKAALDLFVKGGAVPAKLSQLKVLTSHGSLWLLGTMFLSLFLHAGWVHLVGNLWFLWIFGEALEDDLGHLRFLAFYLFSGFFACIFHVLASHTLAAPLIGASGAIAGVMGGYLRRLPQSPILTLVFWRLKLETAYLPAYVWLAIWLALQFYGLRQGGPVAWVAHLGGFATGFLGVSLFTPLTTPGKPATASNPRKKAAPKAKARRKK